MDIDWEGNELGNEDTGHGGCYAHLPFKHLYLLNTRLTYVAEQTEERNATSRENPETSRIVREWSAASSNNSGSLK